MTLRKYPRKKLRAKIIRKGLFTQLPYLVKGLDCENRLFRTVLDYALYDLTSDKDEARLQAMQWFNPHNTDFRVVCVLAGLNPLKAYNMTLFILKSFFKDIFEEFYCHQESNGGILEFSPKMTLLSEEQLKTYL